MAAGAQTLRGGQLPATERADVRLLVAGLGAALLLLAYFLPMFPVRIAAATTRFTDGQEQRRVYGVLVAGQHFFQSRPPLNESLESVTLELGPAPAGGSGWGWLVATLLSPGGLPQHLSYALSLAWGPLVAGLVLTATAMARFRRWELREGFIPPCVQLSVLALPALVTAWAHQFDFSVHLLALAPALIPAPGFWLAGVAGLIMAGGVLGWRRWTIRPVVTWWALVYAVALLAWLLTRIRPQPFLDIASFVADGILVTMRITVTSFVCILVVSLLGGLGRISKSPIIYGATSLYVEIVRGIPLLVQLLFIWYALPQLFEQLGKAVMAVSPAATGLGEWLVTLRLDSFTAAVIGLTVCYGAYGSEVFRAGISSIHRGQMEAARSLGMTYVQAMRYVILPQAVRVILPPVGNEFVALLKDSSLVSVLAVSDLTRRGREYMARTFLSFDTWIMVALCYLVLTLFSSRVVEYIEKRTKFER